MKAELEQLIALQNIDTGLRQLQASLNAIPERRAEIEKEFEQRASEFLDIEKRRDAAQAVRSRLEIEMAETRTQMERAERNLMSSQNQKDYEAAIREVDAARKHISKLETGILEQMEAFEQAEGEYTEREPEIARLRAEKDAQLVALEEQSRAEAARLEALKVERENLVARLPKPMSARYNRIVARIRDGIAVAEARNSSCTACFITLRPQVMAEIRRGEEIITCDNCSRILYYVHAESASQGALVSG